METVIWIIFGTIAALGLAALWLYGRIKSSHNFLVALDQRCETAFADIDVHLKHRHNLIPGLVSVIKGVTAHEKDMVIGVIEARAKAVGAMSAGVKLKAEGNLTANVNTLLAAVEKLPEIRALPEFGNLRKELTDCENRITAARRFHNLAIEEYNTSMRQFPGNLIATKLRMTSRQPYDLGIERMMLDEPVAISF
jgi:LemA protein